MLISTHFILSIQRGNICIGTFPGTFPVNSKVLRRTVPAYHYKWQSHEESRLQQRHVLYEVARCLAFVLYNYSAWYSVPRKPISSTISDKIKLSKYMSLIYFISQISFLILHLKRKVIVCLIQAGRSVLITLFTDTITQSISLSQHVCPYISPRFWTNSSTGFKNGE